MPARDDTEVFIIRRDVSGGQNNRAHGANIADNQATVLTNVDLSIAGQRSKRPGLTLIEDLGSNPGLELFGYEPDGGTNQLVAMEGTNLKTWSGSGSFASRKTNFTTGIPASILKVGESGEGDVFVVGNGTDNWFRFEPDDLSTQEDLGNVNTSPPRSQVGLYFRNRFWVLDQNNLYWSDAFPASYASAFDRTTNYYRIPVGTSRALIGVRDSGIVVIGQDQIWGINPSVTPAATDKPEKILDIGCVANKTAVQVGDDIYFLAPDGVRGVYRTQQDKLQLGASYPISYGLKEEVESLSWAYVSGACAVYFDNKYFISVPVDASTYNNEVWVYYPATKGWMVISGWNVASWAVLRVNGESRLYAIDSVTGKVYRAWYGYSDNGTAISYIEEGRKEDMGQPMIKKAGGVFKVRAASAGNYNINVYVSVDDQTYQLVGTLNLQGSAPVLPVSLPFVLADSNIIEDSFHLDAYGEWYQVRIKLTHTDLNGSDNIIIYETNVTSFLNAYQSE